MTSTPTPSSPVTPAGTQGPAGADAYRVFLGYADQLAQPLIALMKDGDSSLPIEGPPSNHGDDADRLEAFARPLLAFALWLKGRRTVGLTDDTDAKVIAWVHQAIRLGSDPKSPAYWGTLTNYHQHAVEFAIITMALDIAQQDLWDTLDTDARARMLRFLAQIRGHGGHRNNHLFFDVLTLEFLNAHDAGEPGDHAAIAHHLDELACMHRREGWFIDGGNEAYDHYNAYAFHVYGLWWAHRFGSRDPDRAHAWTTLARDFLPSYARLYAATGEPVPVGRSLTYRFNGVGVFPLAALNGIDAVPLGAARRLCRQAIGFFLKHPIGQSQGCLSIGWTDHFTGFAEPYSCAGSPYWAAKGLLMLALEPDHPFFITPEQPIPAEQPAPEQNDEHIVAAPGWVSRLRNNNASIINAGGSSSMSAAARMGAWKWGKLVYHTGVAGLACAGPEGDPADTALCARPIGSDRFIGRHNTMPIEVEPGRIVCQYQLGEPYAGANTTVRTTLWWHDDWFIALHKGYAYQPTVLRAGAFALASPVHYQSSTAGATAQSAHWITQILNLKGFTKPGVATNTGPRARQHLKAEDHALPQLDTDPIEGPFAVACAWSLAPAAVVPVPLDLLGIDPGVARVRIGDETITLESVDWQPA